MWLKSVEWPGSDEPAWQHACTSPCSTSTTATVHWFVEIRLRACVCQTNLACIPQNSLQLEWLLSTFVDWNRNLLWYILIFFPHYKQFRALIVASGWWPSSPPIGAHAPFEIRRGDSPKDANPVSRPYLGPVVGAIVASSLFLLSTGWLAGRGLKKTSDTSIC